jgi:hypothetical protein
VPITNTGVLMLFTEIFTLSFRESYEIYKYRCLHVKEGDIYSKHFKVQVEFQASQVFTMHITLKDASSLSDIEEFFVALLILMINLFIYDLFYFSISESES